MAYQNIGGFMLEGPHLNINLAPAFTSTPFAATGDKLAFIGRFWHKDYVSKNISRVGFRFGTVTKAGGSGLTVSLQDVDLTAGPTSRPDETQDQTVAITNGDASFVSNTWYRTGTLSANRTVAPGERLAVVFEYDGSGRLGSDTVGISNLGIAGVGFAGLNTATKISSTWAAVASVVPNLVLECDDGTFGTLIGARPCSAVSTNTFKQDTAGSDEYALAFQLPFTAKADGMWVAINFAASTSDFDIVLYQGTSALETVSIDANAVRSVAGTGMYLWVPFSQLITFSASTQYYSAVKPTQTTSNVTLYSIDVSSSAHLACWGGGPNFNLSSRLDLGSWAAATTTRRPLMGINLVSFDDATGGGGGVIIAGSALMRGCVG